MLTGKRADSLLVERKFFDDEKEGRLLIKDSYLPGRNVLIYNFLTKSDLPIKDIYFFFFLLIESGLFTESLKKMMLIVRMRFRYGNKAFLKFKHCLEW